jgi:hypothetical protein
MREHKSNTPMKKELYIGLDVHKDSITVAVAQGGRDGEVRLYGTISNDLHWQAQFPRCDGEDISGLIPRHRPPKAHELWVCACYPQRQQSAFLAPLNPTFLSTHLLKERQKRTFLRQNNCDTGDGRIARHERFGGSCSDAFGSGLPERKRL